MRLFIAIPIPKNLQRYCTQMQSQFEGLKQVSDFHITLQFLGDGIESPDKIIESLNKISFEPIEVEMGDAVVFGPTNEPRGVWIECSENTQLNQLAKEIQNKMRLLGLKNDKPFLAHITLGRYKSKPQQLAKIIEGINHHFEVNHFELIQSHLGEKGPHYKTLANFFAKKGKDQ
jgi:2'-5' RNA ligase